MPTIKPMLAVKAGIENIQPGDLISPKLDGIRGINLDGQILSRSLKPIPNKHIQAEWNRKELAGIDGEFILGDPTAADAYRATNSALMRHEGAPQQRSMRSTISHPPTCVTQTLSSKLTFANTKVII